MKAKVRTVFTLLQKNVKLSQIHYGRVQCVHCVLYVLTVLQEQAIHPGILTNVQVGILICNYGFKVIQRPRMI